MRGGGGGQSAKSRPSICTQQYCLALRGGVWVEKIAYKLLLDTIVIVFISYIIIFAEIEECPSPPPPPFPLPLKKKKKK